MPLQAELATMRCPASARVRSSFPRGVRCDAHQPSTSAPPADLKRIKLKAQDLTRESFAPFGEVIGVMEDGVPFGKDDAKLKLDEGTPRFYLMRLRKKPLRFDRITFHGKTTQALGGLSAEPWYMAVARPTLSLDKPPRTEDMTVFKVPPGVYVNMKVGCWHAGPMFETEHMDFYNLELSDTNVTDHNTHVFSIKDKTVYEVEKP